MPLFPRTHRAWRDDYDTPCCPSRILDQHFDTGMRNHDLMKKTFPLHSSWRNPFCETEDSYSKLPFDKDAFRIILDVQQFAPDEITVRTAENYIIVQGKHDEKEDEHGFISRHFTRRYVLPEGHDPNDVYSTLSSDGVLSVIAPKKDALSLNPERNVPITQTLKPSMENPTETVMDS